MDEISLSKLVVETHIGITPEEREVLQKLHVSVVLETDTRKAGKTDAIEDTIDYAAVAQSITDLAQQERSTIECFAEDIATTILQTLKPESVRVTVQKYILPNTEHVAVTIARP